MGASGPLRLTSSQEELIPCHTIVRPVMLRAFDLKITQYAHILVFTRSRLEVRNTNLIESGTGTC
eukprot:6171500-Pleurochrysis_carterae.AAC.1